MSKKKEFSKEFSKKFSKEFSKEFSIEKRNILLLAISYFTLFILGMADNIRGPLFPDIISHFKVNHLQGSFFFMMASFMSLSSALLSRVLLPYWGGLRTLWLAFLCLSLSQLGFYVSSTYEALVSFSLLLGVGFGAMAVSQNFIVILVSPPERLSQWQSGLHSMYGLSSLLSPLAVLFFHWLYPSWRTTFLFVGVLSTSLCLLLWVASYKYRLFDPIPSRKLKSFLNDRDLNSMDSTSISSSNFHSKDHSQDLSSTQFRYTMKSQLHFSLIVALYVFIELLVGTRIATLVRSQLKGGIEYGSLFTSILYFNIFISRVLITFKNFHFSNRVIMRMSLYGTLSCILLGIWWHPVFMILSGLFMGPFYPIAIAESGKIFSHSISSVLSNIVTLSGVLSVFMHLIVGYLTDHLGIQWALSLAIPVGALALILMKQFSLESTLYLGEVGIKIET